MERKSIEIDYKCLKKLRVNKDISLAEMADSIGLKTAGGYLRIEKGENKLAVKHLPILANKFDISIVDLLEKIFNGKLDVCSSKNDKTA